MGNRQSVKSVLIREIRVLLIREIPTYDCIPILYFPVPHLHVEKRPHFFPHSNSPLRDTYGFAYALS